MSYYKCSIPNCRSKKGGDFSLHIPHNAVQRKKWLDAINSYFTLDVGNLTVCHKHFEKRFHRSSKRIISKAYPTLFTIDEINNGHSSKFHEQEKKQIDHNYAKLKTHVDHTYCKTEESTTRDEALIEKEIDHHYSKFKTHVDHTYCETEESTTRNEVLIDITNSVATPSTSRLTKLEHIAVEHGYAHKRHNEDNTYCISPKLRKLYTNVPVEKEGLMDVISPADTTSASITGAPQFEKVDTALGKPDLVLQKKSRKQHLVPKKVCRKRVIRNVSELTPKCKKLYKEFKRSRRQFFNERAKRALDFSKKTNFEDKINKMNEIAKEFFNMQIKMCTKNKKGRRFTLQEKLISLSIMKQSPKAYRFLQKIFILPSGTTLKKMTAELDIRAGINNQLFHVIKEEVGNWKENKKLCTIMFDEMSLEPGLTYSNKEDCIHGFVDLKEKTEEFADHALVFLVKGAVTKWQQPVAFYYTAGAVSATQLKIILKEVVSTIIGTGLVPIALVCDQGASFQSALKTMQQETRGDQIRKGLKTDDTVHIGGMDLSVIFDPPHLIKGIRNNFLTKNIKMNNKISKWDDIVDVYKTDCKHTRFRMLHKLHDEHIIPGKIRKMKVKNCVQVLSKAVSSALAYTADFSHYSDGRPVSSTTLNTAETVGFFDDLFDSVNGSTLDHKKSGGKSLRKAVTQNSQHHKFWTEALITLKNTKFIDKDGKEKSVPSLSNWETTIKSYQRVWQVLRKKNIKVMRPRYMNSDPIENFFGRVRAFNYRNNDPTCHTFGSTFKSLLITGFIKFHSESYNCQDDNCNQLIKVKSLFERNEEVVPETSKTNDDEINEDDDEINEDDFQITGEDLLIDNLQVQAARERLDIHAKAYSVGWVIKKIFTKLKCSYCVDNLYTSKESNATHKWITQREYKTIKLKKLTYPTETAVRYFGHIVEETNGYLESKPHSRNITKNIKNIIKTKYPYSSFDCQEQGCRVHEYFVKISIRLAVFNWCNIINRILKGTDVIRLGRINLPKMQNKAFIKYKKKLKNKKFNK